MNVIAVQERWERQALALHASISKANGTSHTKAEITLWEGRGKLGERLTEAKGKEFWKKKMITGQMIQIYQTWFGIKVLLGFRNMRIRECSVSHFAVWWTSFLGQLAGMFPSYLMTMEYILSLADLGNFFVCCFICPSSFLQKREWPHTALGASHQQVRALYGWLPLQGETDHSIVPWPCQSHVPVEPYHLLLMRAMSSFCHIPFQ